MFDLFCYGLERLAILVEVRMAGGDSGMRICRVESPGVGNRIHQRLGHPEIVSSTATISPCLFQAEYLGRFRTSCAGNPNGIKPCGILILLIVSPFFP